MNQTSKTQQSEEHFRIVCNDPYFEPTRHFLLERFGAGEPLSGRRPAGYDIVLDTKKAGKKSRQKSLDAQNSENEESSRQHIELELVNELRKRVKEWREDGYPGATAVTSMLFSNWFGKDREPGISKPYFAQQEAVETIVYLQETPKSEWQDLNWPEAELTGGRCIDQPNDGKLLRRAVKMATGTGKTLVMGMLIVWQSLNKAENSRSDKYSKNILIIAPNLTVKNRLQGPDGINPKESSAVYWQDSGWSLVPKGYEDSFGNTKVAIHNWQKLTAKSKRGNYASKIVDLGDETDKVFTSRLLSSLGSGKVFVINDEGHHAWRLPESIVDKRLQQQLDKLKAVEKKELEDSRIWIQALEKIQKERGFTACIDMSATPMWPSSASGNLAFRLFPWVVSDFPLADAIESNLTKIPYYPIYDSNQEDKPKYHDLWRLVKDYLPRRGRNDIPRDAWIDQIDAPLKELAGQWAELLRNWKKAGRKVPPVFIAVCDNTQMSETLFEHIANRGEAHPELKNSQNLRTIRYDSAAKKERDAENKNEFTEIAEIVNTVGKEGKPGEQVRCVVSVAMLTEGWDAKNVTHIIGMRPFLSPLLAEQILGRGLRRSGYDRNTPEIVEVYGVPVMLLPQVEGRGEDGGKTAILTHVIAEKDREHLAIEFPRVKYLLPEGLGKPKFNLDLVEPIILGQEEPNDTWVGTGIGAPDPKCNNREEAYRVFNMDRYARYLAAEIADGWEQMLKEQNKGSKVPGEDEPEYEPEDEFHLKDGYYRSNAYPICLKAVTEVIETKIDPEPGVSPKEIINWRYKNMIRDRVLNAMVNTKEGEPAWWPVLEKPIDRGSTRGYQRTTTKNAIGVNNSHLSHAICDSGLEEIFTRELDAHKNVKSWVKNDHRLGLTIRYRHEGMEHFYIPDFIAKMKNGITLIIEAKGKPDNKDGSKRESLRRWCMAVSRWGEMGSWESSEFTDVKSLSDYLDTFAPKEIKLAAVSN